MTKHYLEIYDTKIRFFNVLLVIGAKQLNLISKLSKPSLLISLISDDL